MREIVFVKKLKFNFTGSVTKKAIVIGDADNDQQNELVCGNLQGDLVIFKDKNPNRYAYATELGMVTASVIGDVINAGKNFVAAINTEGWLFIFDVQSAVDPSKHYDNSSKNTDSSTQPDDSNISHHDGIKLKSMYDQRMPANCKELLLADLDGDGQNEVIIGLTDRVLRTYKWIKIGSDRGKFVGLYKWEFADQIGAVSINPSRHENCQDIIVAQPGGTYAKLECFDKKPNSLQSSNNNSGGDHDFQNKLTDASGVSGDSISQPSEDNVRTEYISKLTPEYHQLALAQMRNHHISTEVLGGIRDGKKSVSHSLIVIATLDGTLMLVNKDEILWSLQVDHQLFALAIIETSENASDFGHPILSQSESTCTIVANDEHGRPSPQYHHQQQDLISTPTNIGSPDVARQEIRRRIGSQYFVVCAWNGKTYIIDEERNYLRFKFDQAVSAFTAGNYHFDNKPHPSLVYSTFNNQIVLYYDVILDHIRPMYLLNEVMNNPDNADLLEKLETMAKRLGLSDDVDKGEKHEPTKPQNNQSHPTIAEQNCDDNKARELHNLLQDILYGVTDEELNR